MQAEAVKLFEQLKAELGKPNAQLKQCQDAYVKLKMMTAQIQLQMNSPSANADPQWTLFNREVLEAGANLALKLKDVPAFDRAMSQLTTFYYDANVQSGTISNNNKSSVPQSTRMYPLLGLHLLSCLLRSDNAAFHQAVECLDATELSNPNPYIKIAVQVEQSLMEGRYAAVKKLRQQVPAEEYGFFLDLLMDSIRDEIADCAEKAYDELPLTSAAVLMQQQSSQQVVKQMAQERNWNLVGDVIKFGDGSSQQELVNINSIGLMKNVLHYAREIERIV
ncbi:hypothetical protein MIR68_007785 [Amoeboaphelidium protococcarum]|nr:hypothetical protein MIR68_007785 [Amoeboaphelidium protococcarum]